MTRWFWTLAVVAGLSGSKFVQAQLPPGPDEGGAALKLPFGDNFSSSAKPAPYVEQFFGKPAAPGPQASPVPFSEPARPQLEMNNDIAVTEKLGPWMIFVTSYSGNDAPANARKMALEVRNTHRIAAYVFNYNEEQRKEYERVKAIIEQQRKYLQANNLPLDHPIRVRMARYDFQCGILIGGFPSDTAARHALEQVRKLPPPDPKAVPLAEKFYSDTTNVEGKVIRPGEKSYVNPFDRAFVCKNPATKQQPQAQEQQWDMTALRRLNTDEEFNLLHCKKPITLVIKTFQTPSETMYRQASGGFWESLGIGKRKDQTDAAAHNAHNFAEVLRKAGLKETYVLHTKYSSIVSVGNFDSLEDPNLRSMQNLLESRLKIPSIDLLQKPVPMKVPS